MGKYDLAPTLAAGLLRLARAKTRLTQKELAARAGVTQQAVSAYETGRKEPTLPVLQALINSAGLELQIRLLPLDDHDQSVERLVDSMPPKARAQLEEAQLRRIEEARLSRVRGR